MTKIIVGVEDSSRSRDAVAFARELAAGLEGRLILANVYPHGVVPSREVSPEFNHRLHAEAEATLTRLRSDAGDTDVATRPLPDPSPPRGLHELAVDEDAALIVIGSSERGELGRVCAGTTAERLLHGSPCPVAVVPSGYRLHPGPVRSILVAYDGSEEAKAALHAAVEFGRVWCATIRVLQVIEPNYYGNLAIGAGAAYMVPPDELLREARAELEAEVAELEDGARVQAQVVVGNAVTQLVKHSETADLLVTGSRGYGPHRAVLLGSVSGRLVRKAACPVLVLPRGAATHLEDLAGARAGTTA